MREQYHAPDTTIQVLYSNVQVAAVKTVPSTPPILYNCRALLVGQITPSIENTLYNIPSSSEDAYIFDAHGTPKTHPRHASTRQATRAGELSYYFEE